MGGIQDTATPWLLSKEKDSAVEIMAIILIWKAF